MDSLEAVAIHPAVGWRISDHTCRPCACRVLASADGARVRCAECSAEAEGSHENLCWCGALPAGSRVRPKCVRNKHPTPESPGAIVAIEDGEDVATPPSAVAYLQIDGCDKHIFRCQALRSTLSTERCSANWRQAQRVGGGAGIHWQVQRPPHRRGADGRHLAIDRDDVKRALAMVARLGD
jgi:hypothetical protein